MGLAEHERSLHRYELVERIAVGGMAEVFRAKAFGPHGFEKILAIKRILPDLAMDPEFEQRFIAEAKLAVALTHANIVQVIDFGRFGGTLFLAMEFVDGPDLAALLKAYVERGRDLPVGPALHIAMELAKGLDFAHRRGVVHRDVSPSNILISREGEVKIADFGIAQAAAESGAARSESRRIMGKWRYMSPEQARGERLGPKSDLFSAGSVLWELFTGRKLFPGDDAGTIVRNVCEMPVARATSLRGDLPPGIDEILGRLLEREPEKRFSDASELLRALLEVSYSRTLVAAAPDVADLVAWAFPPPVAEAQEEPRRIDDIIAAELLGNVERPDQTESRVTAVSSSPPPFDPSDVDQDRPRTVSFIMRGEDSKGIPVWEPEAVDPLAKTQRAASQPQREGVSPAPTAPVPRTPASRAGWYAAAAIALVAAGAAITIFVVRRDDGGRIVAPPPADAAPREGLVEIRSEPAGATIVLDGVERAEKTPATIPVAPGKPHTVELRLPGRRVWTNDSLTIGPGEKVIIPADLEPAVARLRVLSRPPGAEVLIDDTVVGTTPLMRDDIPADDAVHSLTIRKKTFADAIVPVKLADGALVDVDRELEPAVRYGTIKLRVDPWAYVYFNGKKIAEAPIPSLRLPVGRQKLVLVNDAINKQKTVYVDVPATHVGEARFNMND
jgi:serine/threonine protein kinase